MNGIQLRWLTSPAPAAAAQFGTPGATWPQQLHAAGLIPAPTIDAAAAWLVDGWQVITDDTEAVAGQLLSVDTTGGPVKVTLPAGGGFVGLRDNAGTWSANPVTVDGNGLLIAGAPTFLLNAANFRVDFTVGAGTWRFHLTYLYGGA